MYEVVVWYLLLTSLWQSLGIYAIWYLKECKFHIISNGLNNYCSDIGLLGPVVYVYYYSYLCTRDSVLNAASNLHGY